MFFCSYTAIELYNRQRGGAGIIDSTYEPLGIIASLDGVVEGLLNFVTKPRVIIEAGLTFYLGSFANRKLVLVRCGIGKVNAAMCTSLMVNLFGANSVIYAGTAGALRRKLKCGDIVLSLDLIQHDLDATALGAPPGVIPGLQLRAMCADAALIGLAQRSAQALSGLKLRRGRILTGDQFIGPSKRSYLRTLFNGTCVEMEGGAIAQVCTLSQTPFLVLSCISERTDGKFLKGYDNFRRSGATNFVQLIKEMLNYSTPAPGLSVQIPLADPDSADSEVRDVKLEIGKDSEVTLEMSTENPD